jgi:hypothetical protein
LPELAAAITAGTFTITTRTYPLAEVETAWEDFATTKERIVITPNT